MTRRERSRRGAATAAGVAVLALALGGCLYDPWQPGSKPPVIGTAYGPDGPPPKQYCYRTLAEVECYSHQLPGAEGRRIGWVDDGVEDDGAKNDGPNDAAPGEAAN
jgi:hypothetical protein